MCWRQSESVVAIKLFVHEHITVAVSQTLKTDSSVLEALSQMLTQRKTETETKRRKNKISGKNKEDEMYRLENFHTEKGG